MLFFENSIPYRGVRSNGMIQKHININRTNSTPNKNISTLNSIYFCCCWLDISPSLYSLEPFFLLFFGCYLDFRLLRTWLLMANSILPILIGYFAIGKQLKSKHSNSNCSLSSNDTTFRNDSKTFNHLAIQRNVIFLFIHWNYSTHRKFLFFLAETFASIQWFRKGLGFFSAFSVQRSFILNWNPCMFAIDCIDYDS